MGLVGLSPSDFIYRLSTYLFLTLMARFRPHYDVEQATHQGPRVYLPTDLLGRHILRSL